MHNKKKQKNKNKDIKNKQMADGKLGRKCKGDEIIQSGSAQAGREMN